MNTLDAEVFAVGTWNGIKITKTDLENVVSAFNKLKAVHRVPIKFGHNNEQPLTDGQPALGWVDDVWIDGKKLVAKFVDIPQVVYEAIQSKLYKTVSIELDREVEHKGNHYPWVLSGVALLGADIPAVNVLSDLQAYMDRNSELSFKKRLFFTKNIESTKNEDIPMDDIIELKAKIATLELEKTAVSAERDRLVQENTDLTNGQIQLKAKFKALDIAEESRKTKDQRNNLETKLDGMVKAAQIAPFSRDELLRDYDEASDNVTRSAVEFAVNKLEKTIESNPAYFGAQEARKKQERERGESDKAPAEVVTQRTREFMAKHGEKSFAVAKTAVLRADESLAERYTKLEA